jgi:hypothetical protein
MRMKLKMRNGVIMLAVGTVALAILAMLDSTTYYQWQQERMVTRVLDVRCFLPNRGSSARSTRHRRKFPQPSAC